MLMYHGWFTMYTPLNLAGNAFCAYEEHHHVKDVHETMAHHISTTTKESAQINLSVHDEEGNR